jgi:hypothetical protein
VADLERQGRDVDDPDWQGAVSMAIEAQDWLEVLETERLHERARKLDVDLPPLALGELYGQYFHVDPEDVPNPPLYLKAEGKRLVRRAIREGEKLRRDRYTFRAALCFGLLGSLGSVLAAVAALNSTNASKIEVVIKELQPSPSVSPAVGRQPAAFDPVEHFFLFPPAGTAKKEWAGEIRSLR